MTDRVVSEEAKKAARAFEDFAKEADGLTTCEEARIKLAEIIQSLSAGTQD